MAKPKTRRFTVHIIRKRMEFLGYVEAKDEKAAEAEAVRVFGLTEEQRKRLVIEGR